MNSLPASWQNFQPPFPPGRGFTLGGQIPQQQLAPPSRIYQERDLSRKILLVVVAARAIVSAILSTRQLSNALPISILSLAVEPLPRDVTLKEKILFVARTAGLIVALVGSILSMPALIIASLAADIAYQIFAIAQSIYKNEYKIAIFHAVLLTADTLALAAIVAGSWQLMTTAIAITAAAVLVTVFLNFPKQ